MSSAVSPIDAVIAWVDGNDPEHIAKRRTFASDTAGSYAEGISETRFRESGEIYIAIASLLKYAPFIRHIWIVTDQQTPAFLADFWREGICENTRITIIDHSEVFTDHTDVLPTFNANSIETMLWRIPKLSERYIYFNDDFFLNGPVNEETFFAGDVPLLHANLQRQRHRLLKVRIRRIFRKITFRPPRNRNNMDLGSDLAAQILGDNEWSLVPLHVPRAMRTSLQRDFYAKHPEVLRQQISFRFRSAQQFIVSALVYQLAFRYAGGIIMNDESLLGYTDARDRNALVTFRMHINASEKIFQCVQSLDEADEETRSSILSDLTEKFRSHLPSTFIKSTQPCWLQRSGHSVGK